MPYVNIKVTRDGLTRANKAALVAGVTDLLVRELGKPPAHIHVVIDPVEEENWGYAGLLTPDWRATQRTAPSSPRE